MLITLLVDRPKKAGRQRTRRAPDRSGHVNATTRRCRSDCRQWQANQRPAAAPRAEQGPPSFVPPRPAPSVGSVAEGPWPTREAGRRGILGRGGARPPDKRSDDGNLLRWRLHYQAGLAIKGTRCFQASAAGEVKAEGSARTMRIFVAVFQARPVASVGSVLREVRHPRRHCHASAAAELADRHSPALAATARPIRRKQPGAQRFVTRVLP